MTATFSIPTHQPPERRRRRRGERCGRAGRRDRPHVRRHRRPPDQQRTRGRRRHPAGRSLDRFCSLATTGCTPTSYRIEQRRQRYQPKFDVQTGHLVGAEALARWTRAGDGAVSPDEFIPAIEASGTAFPFTIWVMNEALTQWADVRQSLPHATLSVNVPGPLISDNTFVTAVEELMKDLEVPGGVLMLEITQRTVADSVAAIARGTDPIDRSVLKACIDIGHTANLSVCVEGVEADAELDLLKSLGRTTVQGFLHARPGTIAELLAYA